MITLFVDKSDNFLETLDYLSTIGGGIFFSSFYVVRLLLIESGGKLFIIV